jgi:excisionase family DNA binding protein
MMKMSADIKFLTIEDVSEMLQVTRTTVYNLKKKGMPFIKLGKNIRFDQDEVVEWIKSNNRPASDNER